jgi:hypothetical protein
MKPLLALSSGSVHPRLGENFPTPAAPMILNTSQLKTPIFSVFLVVY